MNYLIIGGASGVGKRLTEILLEKGHSVYVASRNAKEKIAESKNLFVNNLDAVSKEADWSFLPNELSGVAYCAGSINLKPISRLSLDDFREDFEINVLGAVKSIQKYLDILKKGDKPSIVLFSTVAAKLGMPFHASIAASKSAVEGLVKSLAAEMASTLRINAIAPTVTDTDLASKLLRNEKMIENITERHPLKKFLKPEEVADMAEFLLSEKTMSISGQVFELDCGIVTLKI